MLRVLLFFVGFGAVHSVNILGYFLTPSYSHQITFQPIWRELSLRGHKVTVVTPHPLKDESLVNLTEIDIGEVSQEIWKDGGMSTQGTREQEAGFGQIQKVFDLALKIMDAQMSQPAFAEIISNKKNETFDLVLVEYLSVNGFPLKHVYNCPLVGISSMPLMNIGHDAIGNPSHPVLSPDLTLPFSEDLTFVERLLSVIYSVISRLFVIRFVEPLNKLMRKFYGEDVKSSLELIYDMDLVLANINPILNPARPNIPTLIEFHGIHIKPEQKLPKDLDTLLNNSNESSIIYMSFGSNIKSSLFPEDKIKIILETIAELPHLVLWKYEAENLPNKPNNLVIRKWFPQQDILRHHKVKLFITQGGMQSLDEAMYTKTPVVVIPFFGDQFSNARKVEKIGFGKSLNFLSLNKADFKNTILDVLMPNYESKTKELHDLLVDQPFGSLEKVIWWIEYVIRHKQVTHLKSPALKVPWYIILYLDIIGFFAVCLMAIVILMIFAKRLIVSLCCRRKMKED
ncbi:PREDICTED: UDP-glucuronosyltransferase 1-7C [Nicrophorus vespilloides]|uniref:UDP-glucuronosyltransferase n=1 Tax=Nicrophorus vespilloides TaxID=110193 RepID=A0ABM1N4V7_NICVS|nr:PREDICTED: UDP-glucuronosyltransferase 1-7C [Nicrophorus vespilloides]